MRKLSDIREKLQKGKDDPCWKDYVQVGTKKKNGKEVPNCVPKESTNEEKDTHKTKDGRTAKKGLWYNINQKKKRGEAPAKKGDPDYPKTLDIEEKAVSQAQQKMMGMALAYKRGEMDDASPEVKKMADSMSTKDLEDFAKTKHKGLPVKKESTDEDWKYDSGWKKAQAIRKDRYGNIVKNKNVAKNLAKSAQKKTASTQKEESELDENRYSPLQMAKAKKEREEKRKKDGDSYSQRLTKKQYGGMMGGLKKEEVELDEVFASTVDSHKDGYRPKVVKDGSKLYYLGQHTYKSKEHARNAADHIANAHRKGKASDSYIQDFARRHHKEHGMKESMDLDEAASPERLAIIKRAAQRVKDKKKAARDAEKKASFNAAKRDMQTKGAQRGMAPLKRDLDEGRNDARKALMGLAKQGGIDKATFQKAYDLYSDTKFAELKKLIAGADTDPREAILDVINRHDSRAFNSMYPRGLSKGGLTKESTDLGEAGYSVPSNYAALMLKKRKKQQKAAAKEKWGKDDAEYLKKNTQKESAELDEKSRSFPFQGSNDHAPKNIFQPPFGSRKNMGQVTFLDKGGKEYSPTSSKNKKKVKENEELGEASKAPFKTPEENKAYQAGQRAWRNKKKFDQNPNKDLKLKSAWSRGHNAASAKFSKRYGSNETNARMESTELGEVKIPNNYAAMMAKKRKASLVKDRKTGKMYDPDKEFEKLKNSPEFKDQMKRMAKRDAVGESVELGEAKISVGDRVTLQPNKNTLDRSLIGKAGVVTGMVGSKPTVKFANGKTIAVSPNDLKINESVELGEATYMVTIDKGTYGGVKSDGQPILVKAKSVRDATTRAAMKVKINPKLVPTGGFNVKVNNKESSEHENCGTPDCCGTCDTDIKEMNFFQFRGRLDTTRD